MLAFEDVAEAFEDTCNICAAELFEWLCLIDKVSAAFVDVFGISVVQAADGVRGTSVSGPRSDPFACAPGMMLRPL